jgi:hypothetical protein
MAGEPANAHFSALLAALGKTFGIPDLRPDDAASCTLSFDDHVVTLQQDANGRSFTVLTEVGKLPAESSAARAQALLAGNLFWARTGGATLSLLEATRGVILARQFNLDHLDAHAFETALGEFLNAADAWRAELAAPEGQSTAAAEPTAFPMGLRA